MELNERYKQTDLGIIPIDWEIKSIEELNLDISDGNYSSKYPKSSDFKEIGIPFIRANNIKNMSVSDDDMRFISPKQHSELLSGHLKKDDILITTRGELGNIAIVPDKHIDSNINAQIVRINTNKTISYKYFAYFLSHEVVQKKIKGAETGSALKQLPKGRLIKLPVIIPPLPEQHAIAEALSDVDELIAAQEALIAKKCAIKQGVMQELLTGKRRLPGFSGVWEEKRLGDIGFTYGGLTGKTKEDFDNGNSPYIPFLNILSNPIIDIDSFDYVNIKLNENQNLAKKGDLFFNGSSETPEEVGMCSILLNDVPNLFLNSFCFGFRLNQNSNVDGLFLAYVFRSNIGRKYLYSLAQGATRYNLSKTSLLNLRIPLPKLNEQLAISEVITTLDLEINSLEKRLDKTKALKQGMMQELLTGRIRLTGV